MNTPIPVRAEAPVDASYCPICGQANRCAMEMAKASGEAQHDCWCTHMDFSAELLAQIPAATKGRACVCQTCASQRTRP